MKNIILFLSLLPSIVFAADVTLTDNIDIQRFLRKNPEALVVPMSYSAASGVLIQVSSITISDCQEYASGKKSIITMKMSYSGKPFAEEVFSISCSLDK